MARPARGSLKELFPEVAAQWHPTRNGGVTSADVAGGSGKKAWWKCPKGDDHEWESTLSNRTSNRQGCPCCSGRQVSVTNSLATQFPDVAEEWHPTRNGGLTPAEVVAGSGKKVWWKCPKGDDHEWQTMLSHRTGNGSGCPCCSGRQVSVTNSLATQFPEVARQWNYEENGGVTPDQVVSGSHTRFSWRCQAGPDHIWVTSIKKRTYGTQGCPYCSSHPKMVSVTNSLEVLFPEVAEQWHPTKNGDLTPADVVAGSEKRFWWKCPKGDDHEWQTMPGHRTRGGTGCPCCSGLQVSVTNSLATQFPDVAEEWHPTRNGDLTPADVVAGSNKRFWWKCPKGDDHEWQTTPGTRTSGQKSGCPCCSGRQVSVTNSLATQFPDVAEEWHPTRNGDLTPADVAGGSGKKAWWKCPKGDDHEWQTMLSHRTGNESGCPCCSSPPKMVSVTNSLATQFPDVAEQWHPTRNGDLTPAGVMAGSGKKVWWKCDVADDHEWQTMLSHRTGNGSGCPDCTLTPRSAQEIRLAHELSALVDFDLEAHKLRLGGRSRDVDIVVDELRLVVEFDGAYWHRNKADNDLNKTRQLEEAGWKVIRVRERPLESIHENDVMVAPLAPAKDVADLVLAKIVEVTGIEISGLDEYLASDRPRREAEALAAIRAYLKDQAAKKAERAAKKAERSRESEG